MIDVKTFSIVLSALRDIKFYGWGVEIQGDNFYLTHPKKEGTWGGFRSLEECLSYLKGRKAERNG